MAYEDYLAQIAQNRTDIGQRIAGLPQFETSLREQVYGKEQAIPSLRSQISDKVAALYNADKRMADTYANPGSQMYMRDPYQREKTISTQEQLEVGQIGQLQNLLGARQDVLGSAIEKGMKIYQAGIDAAKFEQESLLAELDAAIKIAAAKRAAAGTAKAQYPTYTESYAQIMANAPSYTPTNPSQTVAKGGYTYAYDTSTGSWYPQELGSVAQQQGLMAMLSQPQYESFNQSLGRGLYEEQYLPQETSTASQRLLSDQNQQAMVMDIQQRLSTAPKEMSGDALLNEVSVNYGSQLTPDSLDAIYNYVTKIMGKPVVRL